MEGGLEGGDKRRSVLKSGRRVYRHKRLRSAMLSLDFFLPHLFTFQKPECEGMPNTNNKIEGIFTDLKKKLNVHCGMSKMSRKRLILEFFLAWAASHYMKPKKPESLLWLRLMHVDVSGLIPRPAWLSSRARLRFRPADKGKPLLAGGQILG